MFIVTAKQMQAAEATADAAGHAYEEMMERAGRAVADEILAHNDLTEAHVLVLVGPGNNGGDGLVTARYLSQNGADVTVYVWKRTIDSDKNWLLLKATSVETLFYQDDPTLVQLQYLVTQADIIVDSLLGTGISRPIAGTLADLLSIVKQAIDLRKATRPESRILPTHPIQFDQSKPIVVAVDLPSGLNSDTGAVDSYTLPADITVTFGAAKYGHVTMPGPETVGQLVIDDIGLLPEHFPADLALELATAKKIRDLLPARPLGAHKGTFGKALLVAGSAFYTGAAMLATQSALRIGTGLVTVAPPRSIYPILTTNIAEATYLPLAEIDGAISPQDIPLLQTRFADTDALLIGPGLSQVGQIDAMLLDLLAISSKLPSLVLDADALNILAKQSDWPTLLPPNCILTPHPGEMARLMGSTIQHVQANRLSIAQEMADEWQQVVLLKGAYTIVAAPEGRTTILPFANPALAKAGSGDVLAGIIVGLLAQGLSAYEAAIAGGYVHGVAGEIAGEELGATSVIAGDLVYFLPKAIQQI